MIKLVRDVVPDLLIAQSKKLRTGVFDPPLFRKALLKKLVEEAREAERAQSKYLSTQNLAGLMEELADLSEVMDAVRAEFGISQSDVEDAKAKKRAARGAFSRRMWCDFGPA